MSKINKAENARIAREHTGYVAERYYDAIYHSIINSTVYSPDHAFTLHDDEERHTPDVVFANTDSVSAVMKEAAQGGDPIIAVLNFASFKNPGGRFYDGSMAQEEALCHESVLYNVLKEFQDYYDWNQKNVNRGLYLNRAIYSQDVLFMRGDVKAYCDVITCACPNRIPAVRYHTFTAEENSKVLQDRIRFIKNIAEENDVDVLILGAFGCGVFMQDPEEVAKVFRDVFAKTTVKKIVYAVPGNNKNTEVFRNEFAGRSEF